MDLKPGAANFIIMALLIIGIPLILLSMLFIGFDKTMCKITGWLS